MEPSGLRPPSPSLPQNTLHNLSRQAYSILGLELCRGLKQLCQMPQIGVGEPRINVIMYCNVKCNWDSNKKKKEFLLPKIDNKKKKKKNLNIPLNFHPNSYQSFIDLC